MYWYGILEKTGRDTRTRTDGHERRTVMTDSYGKDGQLWKRRAVMEKTGNYGKTGSHGKDGNKAFKSEIFDVKIRYGEI